MSGSVLSPPSRNQPGKTKKQNYQKKKMKVVQRLCCATVWRGISARLGLKREGSRGSSAIKRRETTNQDKVCAMQRRHNQWQVFVPYPNTFTLFWPLPRSASLISAPTQTRRKSGRRHTGKRDVIDRSRSNRLSSERRLRTMLGTEYVGQQGEITSDFLPQLHPSKIIQCIVFTV